MSLWWRAALLAWIGAVVALPAQEARSLQPSRNAILPENDINSDCFGKDSATCFKYKIFSLIDRISYQDKPIELTEGVTIVRTSTPEQEGAPRSFNSDESWENLISTGLQNYFDSHTIKVELKGKDVYSAVASGGRALEEVAEGLSDDGTVEGRGKKKKAAKILGPILAALALKAAAILPLILGAIALIAGKALLVGKLALVLSAIIGLKKLLSNQKHVTYEVVTHPHHSSSHSSGHTEYSSGSGYGEGYSGSSGHGGGWGRSINAQDLAYAKQRPQQ